jgi:hypothetical protein
MRKPKPIHLDIAISDKENFQKVIDSLFLDIVKHNLETSSASRKEKIAYIDSIIKALVR